jgi:hypothetical protein
MMYLDRCSELIKINTVMMPGCMPTLFGGAVIFWPLRQRQTKRRTMRRTFSNGALRFISAADPPADLPDL